MPPKLKFNEGEKVLCFHGPLLYEAKVLKNKMQEKQPKYYIHYAGWNKNWDEWVPETRILKYNEQHVQRQKELTKTHAAVLAKNKKAAAAASSAKPKKTDSTSSSGKDVDSRASTPSKEVKDVVAAGSSTPSVAGTPTPGSAATTPIPGAGAAGSGAPSSAAAGGAAAAAAAESAATDPVASGAAAPTAPVAVAAAAAAAEATVSTPSGPSGIPGGGGGGSATSSARGGRSSKPATATAAASSSSSSATPPAPATSSSTAATATLADHSSEPKRKRSRLDPQANSTSSSSSSSAASQPPAAASATAAATAAASATAAAASLAASAETEEEFAAKVEIKIKIPDDLKPWLVDDWDAINRQQKLLELPAKQTVQDIVNAYIAHKRCGKPALPASKEVAITDITSGLLNYFDVMLGCQLLYKFERPQYAELREQHPDKPMSALYGAFHLLRLFTRLGSILAFTTLDEKSVQLLLVHLQDFLKYLVKNAASLFSIQHFVNVTSEYHRKVQ